MSGNVVTLAEIVVEGGLQTGPFGSQLKANEYTEAGIPVVMPKDIDGGKITTHSIAYTTSEKSRQLTKHLIKSGDILFPRRGDLGRIAVAQESNVGWICGTGCLRARLAQNAFPDFIHQYLQLDYVVKWLKSNALGQTMLNLNTEIIGALPIYLPSYEEQKSIAKSLQTWDAAIEKTEALIDAKERQFRWLRQKLFDAIFQTGEQIMLSELVEFYDGYPFLSSDYSEDGSYNILTISNVQYGSMSHSFKGKIYKVPENVKNEQMLRLGDILVSMTGNVGRVCKVDMPNCLLNQRVGKIKAKEELDPDFLYFSIWHQRFLRTMIAYAQGGAQGNLSKKDILKYQITLPTFEEQKRIANTLNIAQREINLLKKLVDQYHTQKCGLMQDLLTRGMQQ